MNNIRSSWLKWFGRILLAAYLVLLFGFGLRYYLDEYGISPTVHYIESYAESRANGRWNINLVPLSFYGSVRYLGTVLGLDDSVNYGTAAANVFTNLFRLLPLGVLIPLAFPGKKLGWTMLGCLFVSLAFEGLQFFTLRGVFDVDDIWLNMVGALLGYGLYRLCARLAEKRIFSREPRAVIAGT